MGRYAQHRPVPRFDRNFLGSGERFSRIGGGALGGKAEGLIFMERFLAEAPRDGNATAIEVGIPRMAVIATDLFDAFVERNDLGGAGDDGTSDRALGSRFQRAELPVELVGDLRALVEQIHQPLAIRSSSLLEDALYQPFAGVYATKMIPNNQHDADTRFRKLVEAVKFVYASTFFGRARDYIRATGRAPGEEKMAVIVQEVVGRRHGDRFYPDISGVARSFNFYPTGNARPEEGVVNLALGLGKTIVDGGVSWTYSPAFPQAPAPFNSTADLLERTQVEFWTVNMGPPPPWDPVNETEYLLRCGLEAAEGDGTLAPLASTYDAAADRLVPGIGAAGPRVLNFAPLLARGASRFNDTLRSLLALAEEALGEKVEIEFAYTLPDRQGGPTRIGFLQTRPMALADQEVSITPEEMEGPGVLASSRRVMGNGSQDTIRDIVYVRPRAFDPMRTRAIAAEVAAINRPLLEAGRPYLLIGFGRWGSGEPTLGIPVEWGQIAGARAVIEAGLPGMDIDPSQGSHFFHNISSFRVAYLTIGHDEAGGLDWDWLESRPAAGETMYVRHVRLDTPLLVKIDGRRRVGVIRHAPAGVIAGATGAGSAGAAAAGSAGASVGAGEGLR
jgi:pyruvate phosphate dikinase-like enzyme